MLAARFDVDQKEPAEWRLFTSRSGMNVTRLSCLNDGSRKLRSIIYDNDKRSWSR